MAVLSARNNHGTNQAMQRWKSDESIKIYARLEPEDYVRHLLDAIDAKVSCMGSMNACVSLIVAPHELVALVVGSCLPVGHTRPPAPALGSGLYPSAGYGPEAPRSSCLLQGLLESPLRMRIREGCSGHRTSAKTAVVRRAAGNCTRCTHSRWRVI